MPEQLERDASSTAAPADADRPRPGRIDYTNPQLIRLLREASRPGSPAVRANSAIRPRGEADALAAARGIATGTLMGAMAWAGFLMGLWLLLHP